jgi:hypothetical protein
MMSFFAILLWINSNEYNSAEGFWFFKVFLIVSVAIEISNWLLPAALTLLNYRFL